jgi:hypothetical protein
MTSPVRDPPSAAIDALRAAAVTLGIPAEPAGRVEHDQAIRR